MENRGLSPGVQSGRGKGELKVFPRFDARQIPAKAAWLGKILGPTQDVMQVKNIGASWNWTSIAFNPSSGRIVAISASGASAYSDDDGLNWTAGGNLPTGSSYNFLVWSGSQFVAANADNSNGAIATSPDGVTWTSRVVSPGTVTALGTNSAGVVVYHTNGGTFQYSLDGGLNWTSSGGIPVNANGLTFGKGLFVLFGNGASFPLTSPDGITWTSRSGGAISAMRGCAFGNGKFVAIGDSSGVTFLLTSTDGINWTQAQIPPLMGSTYSTISLAFGNGLFVFNGSDGVRVSLDGVNWRPATPYSMVASSVQIQAKNVVFGKNRVVAIATSGSANTNTPVHITEPTAQDLYYVP